MLTENKPQKPQPRSSTPYDVSYQGIYEEHLCITEELRSTLKKAQDKIGTVASLDQPVSTMCDDYNSGKLFSPGCIGVPRAILAVFSEYYCFNPYPMGSGFSRENVTFYYLHCCMLTGENPFRIPKYCTTSSKSIDPC